MPRPAPRPGRPGRPSRWNSWSSWNRGPLSDSAAPLYHSLEPGREPGAGTAWRGEERLYGAGPRRGPAPARTPVPGTDPPPPGSNGPLRTAIPGIRLVFTGLGVGLGRGWGWRWRWRWREHPGPRPAVPGSRQARGSGGGSERGARRDEETATRLALLSPPGQIPPSGRQLAVRLASRATVRSR